MPIYAYRCAACGHAQDVLQKMSDPRLTQCPACGAQAYEKQVTAAGFQLKGSGWYATDFKGGGSVPAAGKAEPASGSGGEAAPAPASGGGSSTDGGGTTSASAAPGGCGGSCACH